MRKRITAACILVAMLLVLCAGTVTGTSTATVKVNGDVNIRSGAGTGFSVVRVGHKGDSFGVAGSTKDSSGRLWYKINVGSGAAFIAGWLVTYVPSTKSPVPTKPSPSKPSPVVSKRYAVTLENGTSIRSGAALSSAIIATVNAHVSLRILGESKDSSGKTWYKVDCTALKLKQKTGYVASWVTKVQTTAAPSSGQVSQGTAALLALWHPSLPRSAKLLDASNLRSGPSVVCDRITVLPSGAGVQVTGYAMNDQKETWCRVNAAGKTGWIYAPLLSSWEKMSNNFVTATVGKSLVTVSASVQALSAPFGEKTTVKKSLKGSAVVGAATDGKKVFVELAEGSSTVWVEITGTTAVGGTGPGGVVSTLSSIELVSTNCWTEVVLRIDGNKSGLSVTRLHKPERIEVSLPRLVQPAKTGVSGIPTQQVKTVQVWSASGFVSKIVVYFTSTTVEVRQSINNSAVQLLVSTAGSTPPSKSVFLQNELLCSSNETLFSQNATFIPLVNIANTYGLLLSWDATNQQTSFTVGDKQYVLKDGLRTLKIAQGTSHWNETMGVAPKILRGLLYVPLGTVCHIFGLELSGDALRVYLDPLVTSLSLSGANASSPSGVITVTAAENLKITKSSGDGYVTFDLAGVPAASTIGHQPLASWATVSTQSRVNDISPRIELRLHMTTSTADVQTVSAGVYKIVLSGSKLGKINGKKIILDPGHGYMLSAGHFDYGTIGPKGTKESTINLDIALRTKKLLEADGASVLLTRSDDTSKSNPDLVKRAQMANSAGADLFLAINQNAADNSSTSGTEVNYWSDQSKVLATLVDKYLVSSLKRTDRGVHKSALYLVSHIDTMPSVLAECAFISNGEEESLLRQESFRQKIAQGLADAVVEYFSK